MSICQLNNISKSYGNKKVIDQFSYSFCQNKITAIVGKSGRGKTTILNLIGLLDRPDEGEVILFGEKNIRPFSAKARLMLKNRIGYLFQDFALLEDKTVKYNLLLSMEGHMINNKSNKISESLKMVDLVGFEDKVISQCSGGEQQRIAVARLLLKPCDIILADEPTGSLDEENKMKIFSLLKLLKDEGKTIVMVTHDEQLSKLADEILYL